MAILKVKTQVKASLREQVGEQKYHDDEAVQDVLRYILREDKAPRELIGGFAVNPLPCSGTIYHDCTGLWQGLWRKAASHDSFFFA